MKLQTRLSLVILAIFLCGWLIAGVTTYTMEKRSAQQETIRKAEVLLSTAVAAKNYTSEEVEPLLEEQVSEEFIPQKVPSYAAQQLFARMGEEYQGYRYVEKVLNPTNPNDLAEGWQVELIQSFMDHPELEEITGSRQNKLGEHVLYVAQPIQIQKQSCLRCHSTPEVAPKSLLKTYGNSNGFGWKLNEIVGTSLISIPVSIPRQQAREVIIHYLLLIASIFLVAYTTVSLIVQRWIISPLDTISHLVEQISLRKVGNYQLPEERCDELGKLSKSVNRLLISLNKALSK